MKACRFGGILGDMHMDDLMQDVEGHAWLIDFGMLRGSGELMAGVTETGKAPLR